MVAVIDPEKGIQAQADRLSRTSHPPDHAADFGKIAWTAVASPTKLRPPSYHGDLVVRDRLLNHFDPQHRTRLTVIQAAAGFGKTTLLSQVYIRARSQSAAVCWLSLEPGDNDYRRFLKHLVMSIASSGVAVDERLQTAVDSDSIAPPEAVSALLGSIASAGGAHLVVCIDDYHIVRDPQIDELMAVLTQNCDECVSWAIASRVRPAALPLGRLRLRNELCEISTAELKFTDAEVETFGRDLGTPSLSLELARKLNERTEGWAAGLQIALSSVRYTDDPGAVIERFSGSYRRIGQFFEEEAWSGVDDSMRDFLLATSVLNRLNADLCNFVTERTDARSAIDSLESLNLFIFPLDEERDWYRLHRLFGEYLRRKLRETNPSRWRQVHLRAAQWLRQNEEPLEALELLLSAKEYIAATELLDGLDFASRGLYGIIERYTPRIPDEVLEGFPNLHLDRVLEWGGGWEFNRSRAALATIERMLERYRRRREALPKHVSLEQLQAKLTHRALMDSFVSDDLEETQRLSRKWVAGKYAGDLHMQSSASVAQIAAYREHYQLDRAVALANEVRYCYEQPQKQFGRVFYLTTYGLILSMQGRIDEARSRFEEAQQLAVRLHGPRSLLAAMPALLLAEVHFEQNRLAEARALLNDHFEKVTRLGYVEKLVAGYLVKARILSMEGRAGFAAALRTLDEGETCSRDMGFERLRLHVLSERIRQLAHAGRNDEALFLARRERLLGAPSALMPREGINTRQELTAVSWARAAELRGDIDGARRLLKAWYRFTVDRGSYRSSIRHAAELTRLAMLRGDTTAACEYLRNALQLGAGQFVRTFLDQGSVMRQALKLLATQRELSEAELSLANALLEEFSREEADQHVKGTVERVRAVDHAAVDPKMDPGFSRRELDILELAADDHSNREIGKRLALSENTVKWYWRGIFEKLHVRRRVRAVNIARTLGLIF